MCNVLLPPREYCYNIMLRYTRTPARDLRPFSAGILRLAARNRARTTPTIAAAAERMWQPFSAPFYFFLSFFVFLTRITYEYTRAKHMKYYHYIFAKLTVTFPLKSSYQHRADLDRIQLTIRTTIGWVSPDSY